MKTRIIQTDFWRKMSKLKAPPEVRLLYHYLFTNEYINMCGIYELPDEYILLETGLSGKELQIAKEWLSSHDKVRFYDGWVKVVAAEEHNNYKASDKNLISYKRELNEIPIGVSEHLDSTIHTTIDSSINEHKIVVSGTPDSTPKYIIRNHKSEIINQKEGGVGETKKLEDISEDDISQIANDYQVTIPFVLSKIDDIRNYCASKGKIYKDYKATLRNWVKRDMLERKDRYSDPTRRVIDATNL